MDNIDKLDFLTEIENKTIEELSNNFNFREAGKKLNITSSAVRCILFRSFRKIIMKIRYYEGKEALYRNLISEITELTKTIKDNSKIVNDGSLNNNNSLLFTGIDELWLSVRTYNCLKNENIKCIGDLVLRTESQMLGIQNFGEKSLVELKDILRERGLSFGMKINIWDMIKEYDHEDYIISDKKD